MVKSPTLQSCYAAIFLFSGPRETRLGMLAPGLSGEHATNCHAERAAVAGQLFGEDAFYNTLEDVMEEYRKQTGAAAS